MPANTAGAGRRRGPNRTSWKPGQSGNPKGAPKRGESWAEVIKVVADLTPQEAADLCAVLAGQLADLGGSVTLKQAVVLRTFLALLSEPSASLLNAVMNRAEGSLPQPVLVADWRMQAREAGIDPDELLEKVVGFVMPDVEAMHEQDTGA